MAPDVGIDAGPEVSAAPTVTPLAITAGLVPWQALGPADFDEGREGDWIGVTAESPALRRWVATPALTTIPALVRLPGGARLCRPTCHLELHATGPIRVELASEGTLDADRVLRLPPGGLGDIRLRVRAEEAPVTLRSIRLLRRMEPSFAKPGRSVLVRPPKDAVLTGTATGPWSALLDTGAGPTRVAQGSGGPLAIALGETVARLSFVADVEAHLPTELQVLAPPSLMPRPTVDVDHVVVLVIDGLRADRLTTHLKSLAERGTVVEGLTAPTAVAADAVVALLGPAGSAPVSAIPHRLLLDADGSVTLPETVRAGFTEVVRLRPKVMSAARDVLKELSRRLAKPRASQTLTVVLLPEPEPPHLYRADVTPGLDTPGEAYRGELGFHLDAWRLNKVKKGMIRLEPRDLARLVALYDSDVVTLAHALDSDLRLPERTLLVVTASRGYELGEHGSVHSGHSVFRECVEVPLLVIGPGIGAGRRVRLVGSTERLLGAVVSTKTPDHGLADALVGVEPRGPRAAVSRLGDGVRAVRVDDLRIHQRPGGVERIYDLTNDPGEQRPASPSPLLETWLRDRAAAIR